MTTREEAKAKIDALSDSTFKEALKVIENKSRIERHLTALDAFQESWTPEEQAAWDDGTKRRPWHTTALEDVQNETQS